MARPKSTGPIRDVPITVRMFPGGADALSARAASEAAGNVSEMTRRMLAFGMAHMPKGWRPGDAK